MLVLRWYITHSEPISVIATTTRVKISAIIVHPPSELGLMCRKNTMWTTICTTAKPITSSAVVVLSGMKPVITSQKGTAVRITDSRKPAM